MLFPPKHRVSTNAGLCHENGDVCTAAVRSSSARTVSLGDVSVLSKGKCESCATEVDEPVRELIREQYQNRFAPGNGVLAESVEGFT